MWISSDKQFKVEEGRLYRKVGNRGSDVWIDLSNNLTSLETLMLRLLVEVTR